MMTGLIFHPNRKGFSFYATDRYGMPFEIETITDPNDRKQAEDAYKTLFDAFHDGEISASDRRLLFHEIYRLTKIKARNVISIERLRGKA